MKRPFQQIKEDLEKILQSCKEKFPSLIYREMKGDPSFYNFYRSDTDPKAYPSKLDPAEFSKGRIKSYKTIARICPYTCLNNQKKLFRNSR